MLLPKINQLKTAEKMTLMVQKGALGERVKIFLGKQSSVYLHQEKNETLKLHDHFDLEVFKACSTNYMLWL